MGVAVFGRNWPIAVMRPKRFSGDRPGVTACSLRGDGVVDADDLVSSLGVFRWLRGGDESSGLSIGLSIGCSITSGMWIMRWGGRGVLLNVLSIWDAKLVQCSLKVITSYDFTKIINAKRFEIYCKSRNVKYLKRRGFLKYQISWVLRGRRLCRLPLSQSVWWFKSRFLRAEQCLPLCWFYFHCVLCRHNVSQFLYVYR